MSKTSPTSAHRIPLATLCCAVAVVPFAAAQTAAQTGTLAPAPKLILLSTRFRAPINAATVMERLGRYYDEQVGRKFALAVPEISPNHRYEIWHDMWMDVEPQGDATTIALKRPTAVDSTRIAKGWMLEIAGRLEAPLPLEFSETTPMHQADGELWASGRDAARAIDQSAPMKYLPSWQHAGLLVGTSPLAVIVFATSGLQGIHHVTVTAESAAAAKQIWTSVQRAAAKPCICSAWSEVAQLEEEVRAGARAKSDTLAVAASNALYVPLMDNNHLEEKLREEPEMRKRFAAAQGLYSVKYRLDQAYRKVTLTWLELTGYDKATGKSTAERPLGETALAAPRMTPVASVPATLRTKLAPLAPGGYRVLMDAEDATGKTVRIDERTYWFDGKVFEEQ